MLHLNKWSYFNFILKPQLTWLLQLVFLLQV